MKYFATSSGQGKDQWGRTSGTLNQQNPPVLQFPDFIGTDVAPEGAASAAGTELKQMDTAGGQGTAIGEGVVTVPVAQSAIAVLVTIPDSCLTPGAASDVLPAVTNHKLELEWFTNKTAGEDLISSGSIKSAGCKEIPSLYARSSSSGTTAGFKRYLGHLNSPDKANWASFIANAKVAEDTNWPTKPVTEILLNGVTVKFDTGGHLAESVFNHADTIKGSIGYADLADAVKAGFKGTVTLHEALGVKMVSFFLRVSNTTYGGATNSLISPEAANGESNCSKAEYASAENVRGNEDWSKALLTSLEKGGLANYPICTLTFDLAWHEYSQAKNGSIKYTAPEATSTVDYLKYVVNGGQNSELAAKHYGLLPTGGANILKLAREGVTLTNILF